MNLDVLNGIYCGPAPDPADIWLRWNTDPALLLALAAMALLARRSPMGLAATAVLAIAFVSPLCALSASLFSARVVHHVLIVAVAAPLAGLAWPVRAPKAVVPLFLISTAILWGWHWPAAYDAALSNFGIYWLMQATLFGSAFAFWRTALHPRQPGGPALLMILAAYMQMALLGALLTFAPDALYAIHAVAPLAWGFSPLADQQLGGLIMWVPAGIPFVAFGARVAIREWRTMQGQPA